MIAGLQCIGDFGINTIDGSNQNYFLSAKGSASGSLDIWAGRSMPMVFLRPTVLGRIALVKTGANTYRLTVPGFFEYWVFTTAVNRTNAGLEIFDERGNLVFHAGEKPLYIEGTIHYQRVPKKVMRTVYHWDQGMLTNPTSTINLGGSHFAFNINSPAFTGFNVEEVYEGWYYRHTNKDPVGESAIATTTGVQFGEYFLGLGLQLPQNGYLGMTTDYHTPPGWFSYIDTRKY